MRELCDVIDEQRVAQKSAPVMRVLVLFHHQEEVGTHVRVINDVPRVVAYQVLIGNVNVQVVVFTTEHQIQDTKGP